MVVKLGDMKLLVIAKLFTNARLLTIYELNWQIGSSKWFNIQSSLITKLGGTKEFLKLPATLLGKRRFLKPGKKVRV